MSLWLQRSQGSGLHHCTFPLLSPCNSNHTQLSKHFPFIDLGRQRRTNTWSLKQRVGSARWKHTKFGLNNILNIHGFRLVTIVKLKPKGNSQRTDICHCKIDTCSHENLMPINMYKLLYPHTDINELNKFMNRKWFAHLS